MSRNLLRLVVMVLFFATWFVASRSLADDQPSVIASPSVVPIVGMDVTARSLPYLTEFIGYYFPSRCGVRSEVVDIHAALKRAGPKLILCSKKTSEEVGVALPEKKVEHDGFYLVSATVSVL